MQLRAANKAGTVGHTKPTNRDRRGSSKGPFAGREDARWELTRREMTEGLPQRGNIEDQTGRGQYDKLANRVKTFLVAS